MLLEKLSIQANQPLDRLERFAESASQRYKVFQVLKRNGKLRTIEQPSRDIKGIQRWLIEALFSHFPIHSRATAYIIGRNIRHNAMYHSLSNFTVRIDFRDFFPSFTSEDLRKFLLENADINEQK